MKRFGLIGYKLGHSFSAKYFTEKFQHLGLTDHVYELFPLDTISELPRLLQKHPDLCGLNITIPYKIEVLPFLNHSRLPANLQACNCIRINDGQLTGYNTDVTGFEIALKRLLKPWHASALVLGNGGAAIAVKYALNALGISYKVVGRTPAEGIDLLYEQVTENLVEETKLIVNTTPLGTWPKVSDKPMLPYHALTENHLLYDLIYNPETTAFMQMALNVKAEAENGWNMLVHQAEASWRIWQGAEG